MSTQRAPESYVLYEFGDFRLDASRHLLFRKGATGPLAITPKAVETILYFVEHRGEVLEKERLLADLWPGLVVEENNLTQVISVLRRVLGEARGENRYIATVPGRGYRFVAHVARLAGEQETNGGVAPVVPAAATGLERLRRVNPLALVALAVSIFSAALLVRGWLTSDFEPSSQNLLASAEVSRFTDLEGNEPDAAISPDGKFVVFVSDRDGRYDVWIGRRGSEEFINLTKGGFERMYQEGHRTAGFSADALHVWFRVFERSQAGQDVPSVWLVPAIGGTPRRFLERTVHVAWSPDGTRIVYHEFTPGDPMFIADANGGNPRRIFVDAPGRHCHMQTWSPDGRFIYFLRGPHPNEMDIWRVPADGGEPEQLTHLNSKVGHPTLLDSHTLVYTAMPVDGTSLSLYSMDLRKRTTRRISVGVEEYTTISAGSGTDRRQLVATVSNPRGSLWTVPISDGMVPESAAQRLRLPTARAVSPRFGPDFLLYLSSRYGPDGLWRFKEGAVTELWRGADGGVIGPASIAPGGRHMAFSVRRKGRNRLYLIDAEGDNLRPLAPALDVRDAGSWSADGKWIAVAADDGQGSRIFRVATSEGTTVRLTEGDSRSPVWSPDGAFLVYSASMHGPGYAVKAITPEGQPYGAPDLWVVRGGDRYRFIPDGTALVLLLVEGGRQNFWLHELQTGGRRQITDLQQDFTIRNFDVSPDGSQIIFDRIQENSDIVMIDLKGAHLTSVRQELPRSS